MSAVAVFVGVLELVECGVFGIEQLAVTLQESLVDRVTPTRHWASSSESGIRCVASTVASDP
jgi:hypothetical protein